MSEPHLFAPSQLARVARIARGARGVLAGCLGCLALAVVVPTAAGAASPSVIQSAPKLVSGQGHLVVAGAGETASHELPTGLVFERLEATDGGWVAAGVGGGSRLVVVEQSAGELGVLDRLLSTNPDGTEAPRVAFPRPLVADGQLTGLAWQAGAGHNGLGVHYAAWDGAAWGEIETVAPAAPSTSRLALSAVTLADGSVLAAWAEVDGDPAAGGERDDEIFWSHRTHRQGGAGHWTTPARLGADDSVPDVTPSLLATADGALAAWTAFDPESGQYRLEIARFDLSGSWTEPAALTAPGALFPVFERTDGAPVLTYRDAAEGAWGALGLDVAAATPRVSRRTLLPAGSADERPVLLDITADGARWVAPGAATSGPTTKRGTAPGSVPPDEPPVIATPWDVVR